MRDNYKIINVAAKRKSIDCINARDDYCEELLKISFNRLKYYICLNHCHGFWLTLIS